MWDGKQRLVLLGSGSNWIKVKRGATQGKLLGPLLFLIQINDTDRAVISREL